MQDKKSASVEATRPGCRADCKDAPRPCPWVSCRYHLYLDINSGTGTIKFNFPELEIWEMKHTCALDVAEEGESTFEEIGKAINLTRERIRQLTNEIVDNLYERIFPDEHRHAMMPYPVQETVEYD
jgi:hypothetical protein